MKKLVVFSLALLVAGAVSLRAADAKENWDKNCTKCHGADGTGKTKMGEKLGIKDYTDAKVQGAMTDDAMVKAIKDGAYDYIIKPFRIATIQHTVEKALNHRALILENLRLQENSLNVLRTMVNVLEQRDSYTAGHSRRVTEIAIAIAITAFSPTVALATVVGPLIEVPVMLALVWGAMRLEKRLFGTETAKAAVAAAQTGKA